MKVTLGRWQYTLTFVRKSLFVYFAYLSFEPPYFETYLTLNPIVKITPFDEERFECKARFVIHVHRLEARGNDLPRLNLGFVLPSIMKRFSLEQSSVPYERLSPDVSFICS